MARQTTIHLAEDVATRLEEEAARSHRSVEEVVNEVMREKFETPSRPERKPFRVRPRNMGTPRIDLSCTSHALATLDEMDK